MKTQPINPSPDAGETPESQRSSALAGSAPRFYWKRCYQLAGRVHWALCDTQTDADAPPSRVSCLEMILWDHQSPDLDSQHMPRLIVELLNAHFAGQNASPHPIARHES